MSSHFWLDSIQNADNIHKYFFFIWKEPNNSLIKISYDIYNRVTINQIHNNFNQNKFLCRKNHDHYKGDRTLKSSLYHLEHVKFSSTSLNLKLTNNFTAQFDFLGKDSIKYYKQFEADPRVYKAVEDFREGTIIIYLPTCLSFFWLNHD